MENPWKEITESRLVLPEDQNRISDFNNRCQNENCKIQIDLIPDPFFGNKDAKVVLLMLNPGFGGNEKCNYATKNFEKVLLNNLKQTNTKRHFFSLDKAFVGTDAYNYWKPRVKELNNNGMQNDELSEKLFCINLFPYHSRSYKKLPGGLLESQKYSLFLLDNAIKDANTIVVSMRSYRLWEQAYKEIYEDGESFDNLLEIGKMIKVKNYRNPTLSTANLGDNNFNIVLNKLKGSFI